MCSEPALVSSIPAHIDLPRPSFVPHQPRCSTPLCLFTLTPPLTSPPLGHYSPFASLSSSSCSSSFASSSTSSSSSSSSFSNCRSENSNFLTIPTSADPLGPPRCSTYSRTTPRHRRQRSRPSIPISFFSAAIPTPPIPALTSPFDTKPLGLNRGSILNLNLTTHSSINAGVTTAAETLDFLCTTFTTAQLCSAAAAQQTGMLLSSNHGTHHHHHHHHASMPFDHQQMHGGFDASSSSSSSSSTGHYAVNATGNGSSSSSSAGNGRTNNRPHGHGHSVSSDSGRPRSVSSRQDSGPSQRTPSQVGVSHDSGLTDEQRLSTLRQQQAQRRPKMVRLTPAVKHLNQSTRSMSASMSPSLGGAVTSASSSINANGESSRPASVVGIASLTGYSSSASSSSSSSAVEADPQVGLTIFIDPKSNGSLANAKVIFPMVGSPPNAPPPPLHPGSRRALAQRAGLQPADGASLQLDLGCISGPSVVSDTSASANSASTLPDLVRKKSGEPVKSSLKHFAQSAFLHRADSSPAAPASFHRAKSVPTTPTSSKAVHFDPVLEHVKVFKHRQRPTAVSRDGSPEHTETETEEEREFPFYQNWRRQVALNAGLGSPGGGSAGSASPGGGSALSTPTGVAGEGATEQLVLRLPNFPSSAKLSVDRDVFLERVFLSDDLRSVKGTVQVRNLAFEKWLAVRFSLDGWATACEVSAEHSESIKGGKSDRFTFSIKLNELLIWGNRGAGSSSSSGEQETKTMLLCLRYNTAGQEFWDNNEGLNYQLDFRLRPVVLPSPGGSGSGSGSGAAGSGSARQHRERAESASSASGSGMARAATVTPARTKGHSPGMSPSELGSSSSSSRRPHHRNQHNLEAEELGRSLEKLRAEDHRGMEDDDDDRMPLALRVVVKNRRRSPPVSPGLVTSSSPTTSSSNGGSGGRSSSPSMWAARYDLSESLKNPKTGSRITSAGRQAALDYFSAKPPAPPSSSSSSTGGQQPRAIFIGTSAGGAGNGDVFSPSEAGESPTPGASRGSDGNGSSGSGSGGNVGGTSLAVPMGMFTTKAGMISPGLGEVIAHLPMSMTMSNGSGTASPSTGGNSPVSETNGGTPDASSNSTTMVMESSPPGSNMTSSSSSSSLNNNNSSHMTSMTTMRSSEANGSRSSMHTTKFYSYPVNRNTLSPAGQLYRLTRGSDERASSPLARTLAQQQQQTSMYSNHSTSSISSISPSPSPSQQSSGRESPVKKDRGSLLGGGVILSSNFLNDSPQNSPISPLNSPNPFSPTLSISSLESEMTTCLASPEDAVVVVSSGGNGNGNGSSSRLSTVEIRVPPPVSDSIEDIHRSLLNMARGESSSVLPISVVATMGVGNPSGGSESNHSSATAGSGSPTLSAVSDSSSSTSSSIKPGSVSSYDELIARFCWNGNDNGTTTSSGTPPVVVVGAGPGAVVVVEETTTTGSDVDGLGGEISSAGGMHIQHVPHRMFASSMGSPTTESGSTTPTIGF
ncbi:hypothetical protein CF326_g1888 [Tilletia indica]|nr:hypothetical protein CF326_g1888 [Tilletia indica]